MTETIIKRDGRIVNFNKQKIAKAMRKAFNYTNVGITEQRLNQLVDEVVSRINHIAQVNVETIQDIVEDVLLKNDYIEVGKNYIRYRNNRTSIREKNLKIHQMVKKIIIDTDRENANVGNGPSSKLLQIAEAEGKEYAGRELLSNEVRKAIEDNILYCHDFPWAPLGTTTCVFIPLRKLLLNGFSTDHGYIRSPKRIKSAAALSCIILQSSQNDQHGGQAFGWFDRDLAPFVEREYEWQRIRVMETLYDAGLIEKELPSVFEILGVNPGETDQTDSSIEWVDESLYKEFLSRFKDVFTQLPAVLQVKINQAAWKYTAQETQQAMESVVFNLNTMHSRAGAQVPFSSINIGTDTTREGRLVCEMFLKAYNKGLGRQEQPIFPIVIFKKKNSINALPGTPNYDLYQLSMKVSSNRLFPNYCNQDSSFNKDFPGDIPSMGCRTRVAWNINKPDSEQTCEGRGNTSFSTINMVNLALRATRNNEGEDYEKYKVLADKYGLKQDASLNYQRFIVLLNKAIDTAIKQIHARFEYQCGFKKKDFPFLLSGVWMDSESLKKKDNLREVWKHGTLSIGFIGLAETLKCLTGYHHAESPEADALGEEIIMFMRKRLDEATSEYHLNFTLLATPAEGLTGKLLNKDRELFGIVPGVTDKEWYTNSFHCPVEYVMSIKDKIRIEGKYHKYCNAGQISYIELDSSIKSNPKAYEAILNYMWNNDMGYVAINFPVDRCKECGYAGDVIEVKCPKCGSHEISRIRRITGYLAELEMFNKAKQAEASHRRKHIKNLG